MTEKKLTKRPRTINLSLEPEAHDALKAAAAKKKQSIPKFVTKLLSKLFLNSDELPVLLKIPSSLKNDKTKLLKWLEDKSKAIADVITKQP